MKKKIVIKDGRTANLYKVEEFSGKFVVHHVRVGILFSNEKRVGAADSFDGAISLVKSHAGTGKLEIKPW